MSYAPGSQYTLYPQLLYTVSQVRTTNRSWDEGVLTDLCLTLYCGRPCLLHLQKSDCYHVQPNAVRALTFLHTYARARTHAHTHTQISPITSMILITIMNLQIWSSALPTDPVTSYSATDRRLRTTLVAGPISRPAVSISVDTLRSIWLANDLKQTSTWSKLSPPDYTQCTHIYSTPGYKSRRQERKNTLKWQRWLRGCLVCTICYSCAMYIARYE